MGIMPDFLVARRANGRIQIGMLELSLDSSEWTAKPIATISTTSFRMGELANGEVRRLTLGNVQDGVAWMESEGT